MRLLTNTVWSPKSRFLSWRWLERLRRRFRDEPQRDFVQEFLCVPSGETPREAQLRRVAERYHEKIEAFDAALASAHADFGTPVLIGADVGRSVRFARVARQEAVAAGAGLGFSADRVNEALFLHGQRMRRQSRLTRMKNV